MIKRVDVEVVAILIMKNKIYLAQPFLKFALYLAQPFLKFALYLAQPFLKFALYLAQPFLKVVYVSVHFTRNCNTYFMHCSIY
jgi:hypothetical protein